MKRMGRSQAQLARNARDFGESRGTESDGFVADWARIRTAYVLATGAEREELAVELMLMEDHFQSRQG